MSLTTDLEMAYHMGYDDALARRKPDASKVHVFGRRTCQKVYLVETSDDLIESWYPIGVYLNSEAAGYCAEALRGEVDGIRQFARVVELKVVADG